MFGSWLWAVHAKTTTYNVEALEHPKGKLLQLDKKNNR